MKQLFIPRVGEGVQEVQLVKWTKKVGDPVNIGDVVAEIATDKVDSDVVSDKQGIIARLLWQEGEYVGVGEAIIDFVSDEDSSSFKSLPTEKNEPKLIEKTPTKKIAPKKVTSIPIQESVVKKTEPVAQTYTGHISPLVGKMMSEYNIKSLDDVVQQVGASGINGRVTKQDILNYQCLPTKATTTEVLSNTNVALEERNVDNRAADAGLKSVITPMNRVRALIADNLKASLQISAHVTSFIEADVTPLVLWKNKNAQTIEQQFQTKITYTPLFIQAVVKALMEYPMMNSSLSEKNEIIQHQDIHIGLAAALPNGNLVVPVIKNANYLNLLGIAKEANRLAKAAKEYTINPNDCKGSTFTISNIGATGTIYGTPIINQPEVAILAIGAIKKRAHVVVENDEDIVAIRSMLYLSLSYDHRIIDGMLAGLFLKSIVAYLEEFDAATKIM